MDLQTAQEEYEAADKAYKIALGSQSYSIGGRSISHQPLEELRAARDLAWRNVLAQKGISGPSIAAWN